MTTSREPLFFIEHTVTPAMAKDERTTTRGLVDLGQPELELGAAGPHGFLLGAGARTEVLQEVARQFLAGHLHLGGTVWFDDLTVHQGAPVRRGGTTIRRTVAVGVPDTGPAQLYPLVLRWTTAEPTPPVQPGTVPVRTVGLSPGQAALAAALTPSPTPAAPLADLLPAEGGPWYEAVAAMALRLAGANEEQLSRALWVAEHPAASLLLDQVSDLVWSRAHQSGRPQVLRTVQHSARDLADLHLRLGGSFVTENPNATGTLRGQYHRLLTQLFSTALASVAVLDHLDTPTLGASLGPWLWQPADHRVVEALLPRDGTAAFADLAATIEAHPEDPAHTISTISTVLGDPDPPWQQWVRDATAPWVTCSVDVRGVHDFVTRHLTLPTPTDVATASDALRTLTAMRCARPDDDHRAGAGAAKDRATAVASACAGVPAAQAWLSTDP